MQAPAIGSFGSANISVGTGVGDRTPPVVAMVGLVSISIFDRWADHFYYMTIFLVNHCY